MATFPRRNLGFSPGILSRKAQKYLRDGGQLVVSDGVLQYKLPDSKMIRFTPRYRTYSKQMTVEELERTVRGLHEMDMLKNTVFDLEGEPAVSGTGDVESTVNLLKQRFARAKP